MNMWASLEVALFRTLHSLPIALDCCGRELSSLMGQCSNVSEHLQSQDCSLKQY